MNRLFNMILNLFWLVACLPNYIRFKHALYQPRRTQERRLQSLLCKNQNTVYGRHHQFRARSGWETIERLPVTTASDYTPYIDQIMAGHDHVLTVDPVTILQPTSGTSASPKLIPFTKSMGQAFRNGLDPWIADLYLRHPRLLFGKQHWTISPVTRPPQAATRKVPVGFLDDIAYFGPGRRWFMQRLLAVPPEVRELQDMATNNYVTLLFLLRNKQLRLMSFWHPSLLTVLLDTMMADWESLLVDIRDGGISARYGLPDEHRKRLSNALKSNERRYRELQAIDPHADGACMRIWPNLQLISCWGEENASASVQVIESMFPGVTIQPKGLLATEGVVTIPFGKRHDHVCAVRSHVFEFLDQRECLHPLWDLEQGQRYRVVLTTEAGHYRYGLGDCVEVTGYLGKTPCLRFCGRSGVVSDCVGEKLHLEHVERVLAELRSAFALSDRFMMLMPSSQGTSTRYQLLLERRVDDTPDLAQLCQRLEQALSANYHYRHARNLKQLEPAAAFFVPGTITRRYRELLMAQGAAASTVKYPALCTSLEISRPLLESVSEASHD